VCGEDKAKEAILPILVGLEKNDKIESFDSESLVEEARRILEIGIKAGSPKTGGKIYIRSYQ
jgi:hypothetical protein